MVVLLGRGVVGWCRGSVVMVMVRFMVDGGMMAVMGSMVMQHVSHVGILLLVVFGHAEVEHVLQTEGMANHWG